MAWSRVRENKIWKWNREKRYGKEFWKCRRRIRGGRGVGGPPMVKLCVCYQVKCVTVCFHFLKKSYNITACCARAFKVRDMLLDSQLSATYTLYSVPHKKTGRNLLFFLPLPLCCVVDPTLNSRIQFEAKRRFPSDARGGGGTEVNNVYAVLRWSMNSNLGINFPSDIDFRGKGRVVYKWGHVMRT